MLKLLTLHVKIYSISFLFQSGAADVFQKYLESRKEENRQKKSSTENWLTSLHDDIESLQPLKKAKLKLQIQTLIVDAMEEEQYQEFE